MKYFFIIFLILVKSPALSGEFDPVFEIARVVYAEAAGEPSSGKHAIASVILNRVQENGYPNTIYKVIHQKNAFSAVKTGNRLYEQSKQPDKMAGQDLLAWEDCVKQVEKALYSHKVERVIAYRRKDCTNGNSYFNKLLLSGECGEHYFYETK